MQPVVCCPFPTPTTNTPHEQADDHPFFKQPFSCDFQPAVDFLMEDSTALLKKIVSNEQHNDKISLLFGPGKEHASYNFVNNTILFSASYQHSSTQEKVAFLFFELQNALQREAIQGIYNNARTLGKKHFVEQIETVEYRSTLATCNYVHSYASKGIFTKDVPYFRTPIHFDDYYHYQQLTGHAQNIATQFNIIVQTQEPYVGTWPKPLDPLHIPILKELLINKTVVESLYETPEDKQAATQEIKEVMNDIDSLYSGDEDHEQTANLWTNAHEIFKSQP